ncbi:AAA family ATPase [Bradyrhizobium sp. 44]|uniref:AAA family ATPase n=1 Tax=Bradyrhizobium sp. 44 TaxID=2782675 RepID=UPI001FFBDE39|nr:AAA family ATPase [Bradyrhizobium sp. 44]MCK1287084.1 AAA family ATPase [Bradyrhizobium sp. 44]
MGFEMVRQGFPAAEIAEALDRTPKAVRSRANRLGLFKAHHSIAEDPDRLVFMRSPTNLGDPAQFEELKAAIAASGRQFRVVAVDTVGRALPGEDFYDAKSITGFMERLQQLGEIGQGVAIGVHHVNKSGDAFGSVYFGASSDFMFQVEREGDGPLVRGKITCTKMKDGEDGWKRRVDYQKAAGSLVVTSVADGGDMMGKALKLTDDDRWPSGRLARRFERRGNCDRKCRAGRSR